MPYLALVCIALMTDLEDAVPNMGLFTPRTLDPIRLVQKLSDKRPGLGFGSDSKVRKSLTTAIQTLDDSDIAALWETLLGALEDVLEFDTAAAL